MAKINLWNSLQIIRTKNTIKTNKFKIIQKLNSKKREKMQYALKF